MIIQYTIKEPEPIDYKNKILLLSHKVTEKDGIINVRTRFNKPHNTLYVHDDLFCDNDKVYHEIRFSEYINEDKEIVDDIDSMTESISYSFMVNVRNYRSCYHYDNDGLLIISLIPYKLLDF